MEKVIQFHHYRERNGNASQSQAYVNGRIIKARVMSNIDFSIPDFMYLEIDHALGNYWNNLKYYNTSELESIVFSALTENGMILGRERIHDLVIVITHVLVDLGYLKEM